MGRGTYSSTFTHPCSSAVLMMDCSSASAPALTGSPCLSYQIMVGILKLPAWCSCPGNLYSAITSVHVFQPRRTATIRECGREGGTSLRVTEKVWRGRNTRRVPRNFVYLWNLTRVQNRVGHAGEGRSDVESDCEGLSVPVVGFAGCPRLLHEGRGGGWKERCRWGERTETDRRTSWMIF